jgi:hypothetical protein
MYNPLHSIFLAAPVDDITATNTPLSNLTAGSMSLVFSETGMLVRNDTDLASQPVKKFQVAYKKRNGEITLSPILEQYYSTNTEPSAFIPMTPKINTITLTGAYVSGTTYTISLLLQIPDLPRPYTEFMVSLVSGGSFTTLEACATELARLLNTHPVIRKAITAAVTPSTSAIRITENIPDYDIMQRQRYVRNQYIIKATQKLAAAGSQPTAIVPATTQEYKPGCGAWQLVSDLEKRSQGRYGITNITEFPVTLPSTMTEVDRGYSFINLQFKQPDRDAANASITRDISVDLYMYNGDGGSMSTDAAAGLTMMKQALENVGYPAFT